MNPTVATVQVHIQPRASNTEIVGMHGDAIKIRIKSPPVDGAANDELVKFLARALAVKKTAITMVRGVASRRKTLKISGLSKTEILAKLGVA